MVGQGVVTMKKWLREFNWTVATLGDPVPARWARTFASLPPETRLRVVRNYANLDFESMDGDDAEKGARINEALRRLEAYIAGVPGERLG